jgi:hypothetical protein
MNRFCKYHPSNFGVRIWFDLVGFGRIWSDSLGFSLAGGADALASRYGKWRDLDPIAVANHIDCHIRAFPIHRLFWFDLVGFTLIYPDSACLSRRSLGVGGPRRSF